MMTSNQHQAEAFAVPTKRGFRTVRRFSQYPAVASTYPNRSVRRTLARGRLDLLPTEWRTHITNLNLGLI